MIVQLRYESDSCLIMPHDAALLHDRQASCMAALQSLQTVTVTTGLRNC
jgi:hypothetical protein